MTSLTVLAALLTVAEMTFTSTATEDVTSLFTPQLARNFMMDMLQRKLTDYINYDKKNSKFLNDFEKEFYTDAYYSATNSTLIRLKGGFKITGGSESVRAAVIDRYGDTMFDGESISARSKLKDLNYYYEYNIYSLNYLTRGSVTFNLGENNLLTTLKASKEPDGNTTCSMHLSIESMDGLEVIITKLGLFESLRSKIKHWVTCEFIDKFNKTLQGLIQKIPHDIKLC